jgi:hypothetical protein
MPYPAKKNPKLLEEVLSRIAGGETLAALGRELDFHPQSWADWMRADEGLAVAYARARDVGADVLAEQALALIDGEPDRVDGKIDPGFVQWKRAQVDTRLKLLACWNPKKYGTKQTHEIGNKEGETLKVESNADNIALTLQLAEALLAKDDK